MKKKLVLAAFAAMFSIAAVNAQGGGNFQRRTPEERLKPVHEKLDSAFKFDAEKFAQVDAIFLNSFKDQDAKMEELRAAGQPDRETMMALRQKLNDERDAKLKPLFTDEQMKIWKEQLEPSLRPQRGNRQGGQ
jgi:periplasmic protein CpxP/Spy